MDIKEIESAMHTLACGETTYETVARLASLVIVRDHLTAERVLPQSAYSAHSGAAVPEFGDSEFLTAVANAPLEAVMHILDEHMDALQVVIPAEYDAVMRKLKKL